MLTDAVTLRIANGLDSCRLSPAYTLSSISACPYPPAFSANSPSLSALLIPTLPTLVTAPIFKIFLADLYFTRTPRLLTCILPSDRVPASL